MTHEELVKIAYGTDSKNPNINFEVEVVKMEKSKKAVSNVLKISKKTIAEFCKTASKEDYEWIRQRSAQLMVEKEGAYFPAFRTEFAKKFFPEMVTEKKKKQSESFLDMIERARQEAKASA